LSSSEYNEVELDFRASSHNLKVELVKRIRQLDANFSELVADKSQDTLFPSAPTPSHLKALHGIMNLDLVKARLLHETKVVLSAYGQSWSKDVKILSDQVETWCPPWGPVRDTLLDNQQMCDALVNNQFHGNIGPVCQELRSQLKFVKTIHSDRRGATLSNVS
jgi:hypothetical protein